MYKILAVVLILFQLCFTHSVKARKCQIRMNVNLKIKSHLKSRSCFGWEKFLLQAEKKMNRQPFRSHSINNWLAFVMSEYVPGNFHYE